MTVFKGHDKLNKWSNMKCEGLHKDPAHFLFNEVHMKARTFITGLIIITLMLLVAPLAVQAAAPAQDATPPPVPESVLLLIPILVGSIGVPVTNWLKKTIGWTADTDKIKNIWLTFGVALGLAVISLLITQSFIPLGGPETLVTWLGLTFTVATLIYKSMSSADPAKQN